MSAPRNANEPSSDDAVIRVARLDDGLVDGIDLGVGDLVLDKLAGEIDLLRGCAGPVGRGATRDDPVELVRKALRLHQAFAAAVGTAVPVGIADRLVLVRGDDAF